HWILKVEQVDVDEKHTLGRDGEAVKMRGAENEWPRPIGQSAGRFAQRRSGAEEAIVIGRRCRFPQNHTEGAAEHIGTFSRRKDHSVDRAKVETESEELERQAGHISV